MKNVQAERGAALFFYLGAVWFEFQTISDVFCQIYNCREAQNNQSLLTFQNRKESSKLKTLHSAKILLVPALHCEIVMCTTNLWNWLVQKTSTNCSCPCSCHKLFLSLFLP
jgi:hypothetical protein